MRCRGKRIARYTIFLACAAGLCCLAAAIALPAGCSRNSDSPAITFVVSLLPAEQVQYMQVLRDFTAQTGIRVNLVAQQYEQVRTVIEAEAAAGRGRLDLVELDVFQLPLLQSAMQPLEPLVDPANSRADQSPRDAWLAGRLGAPPRLLYVPHRLNWQAMLYDVEAIPEPPADWDALLATARAHPGRIGLKCSRGEGLVCDVFPFLWQAGGDPLRPDSPEALAAMQYLRDLSAFFNSGVRAYQEESIRLAQELREIVLHYNWPFVVPIYRDKDLLPSRIRTAPMPAGPAGLASVLGGGYIGVPATAPHPREAGRLIDYLLSPAVQKRLANQLGWFPVRPEGWEGFSKTDRALYAGYMVMQPYVRARPNVPYYPAVSRIWQNGFYAIVFGGEDPVATLKQMQADVDAAAREASP